MANKRLRRSAVLALERLELREVPATSPWTFQNFEQARVGVLPDDWQQMTTDPRSGFRASNTKALGSEIGLRSDGGSTTTQRTWLETAAPADAQVSVDIYLDRLIPAQLIARGDNLDTSKPSFYAATITRGLNLQLIRVQNGQAAVLATLKSKDWISNRWVRLSLTTVGDTLKVQVFRTDTAQYLNADGRWQFSATDAIVRQDGALTQSGHAGLGRSPKYAGTIQFDNFQVAPAPAEVQRKILTEETFARPVAGGLPAGWTQWSGGKSGFRVSTARALTGSSGLTITTPATEAVRSWRNTAMPGDVDVNAAIYLNSLVPGEIIARGTNLNSEDPTYYAATITRGLELQIVRVVNGQRTVLAAVDSQSWISNQWVHVTFSLQGDMLRALVYRSDSAKYLSAAGTWQETPVWAVAVQDDDILGGGYAGLGRAAGASGSVTFDNFSVTQIVGQVPPAQIVQPLPEGWTQWANNSSIGFELTQLNPLTPPTSLTSGGGSDLEARAWMAETQPADVQVSAAAYLDSLVPVQVILRGKNLDSSSPSYYAVTLQRGLVMQLTRVVNGQSTVLGTLASNAWDSNRWIRVHFEAQDSMLQVQLIRAETGEYLNEDGDWQTEPAAALVVNDTAITDGGYVGLGRQASYSGRIYFDDFAVEAIIDVTPDVSEPLDDTTVDPTPAQSDDVPLSPAPTPINLSLPHVDRHYSHIRIAQLAYFGTPLGGVEQDLLQNSVDLVVPNTAYLDKINAISPNTPQFIYSNASNIYRELLTDWLTFADGKGYNREAAFYHVTQPTEFTGDSASSVPVNRFWSVQVGANSSWSDRTTSAYSTDANVRFGGAGQSVAIGYLEKFREINLKLIAGASGGWSGRLEYVAAVDSNGNPTVWKSLPLIADGTSGFRSTGTITFDPPRDWVPASVNGSEQFYYVRIRTITGGTAPMAATILGRDYVNAAGRPKGVIPAFDKAADLDGDGYLNDAEYTRRTAGKDARFYYESRAFYPAYGQHRYATNVANSKYQEWSADFSYRFLQSNPAANGLFMDNSLSKITFDPKAIEESLANYAENYAVLLEGVNKRIAPKWVLVNIAGGGVAVDALAKRGISYLEEFLIRPMSASYSQFEDVAGNLARRLSLSGGKIYAVLDSLAPNGTMTDPRVQIGTLAYYYLLAHPEQTMLMFNGGNEPNTTWSRHWSPAVEFDVGQPLANWSILAAGKDPANTAMTYKVYQRQYENALVIFKPLSYNLGRAGTTEDDTATVHYLNGAYRPLQADGTLGAAITSLRLRNGEGAILVKA